MKNWLKPILIMLRNIAIPAIIYSAIIFLMVYFLPSIKKPWYEAFKLMNSPSFYIGLVVVIILVILQSTLSKQLRDKISRYMLLGVPIIIISLGIFVIMVSYNKPLWENLPYNLTAFGVGVSMSAVGLAFLFAFPPSKSRQGDSEPPTSEALKKLEGNASTLSAKMEALNKKFSKAEKTIDAFLEESQKLTRKLTALQKEERRKR